jgi:hypothetical protein
MIDNGSWKRWRMLDVGSSIHVAMVRVLFGKQLGI